MASFVLQFYLPQKETNTTPASDTIKKDVYGLKFLCSLNVYSLKLPFARLTIPFLIQYNYNKGAL